ncbi:phosphoglycerate mutase [Candidatus Woesearchaeota archaeon]|nr:MAG: phosphoglycerate mutase [Candidatus Woesearchaeota archaeon]
MSYLILVRHGESRWNIANKFTGWVDVPLSPTGVHEALIAAQKLKNVPVDIAFTSKLVRAHETLLLILSEQEATGIFLHSTGRQAKWSLHPHKFEKNEIPIIPAEALNERYYGTLQGMDKHAARRKWGEEQVFLWRRSYDVRPPGGESLKDVYRRVVPYFKKHIVPHLRKGKTVLVVAHGNSLRAMIKHIENIPDKDIPHLELALGKPLIYRYGRGQFKKENFDHAFTRPLHWTHKRRALPTTRTRRSATKKTRNSATNKKQPARTKGSKATKKRKK